MLLIAGLGNPGPDYAGHRHNVGFMALDAIHRRHGFGPWRRRFRADVAEGNLGGAKVLLVKPLTYMNESGRSVGEAMRFYKLEPADVLVIHDEVDLPPGKMRMKTGGGAAGHNGLRSISGAIGDGYRRLRIGVGHPGVKELVPRYVLHDFAKADRAWLDPLLDATADHVGLLAEGKDVKILCVGRKGYDALRRQYGTRILELVDLRAVKRLAFTDAHAIGQKVSELFEAGHFDVATIFYAEFRSVISQVPTAQQLIPASIPATTDGAAASTVYEYEADEETILADLLPRNLSVQVFRALLENAASEMGAKMSAMDSATRNAGEMINKLTLNYNRSRQAQITKELIEIISGAEAL